MAEREAVKQSAELLRKIIRSVDKRLEYSFIDPGQEGRFSLRLSIRGRVGTVSRLTDDLRQAVADDVRKNAIRQKIKSMRDSFTIELCRRRHGEKNGADTETVGRRKGRVQVVLFL